jgi:TPR repeat protein
LKGEGVPQNYIESYKWANLASATGLDEAKKLRENVIQYMTPSQIEEGQRLASIEAMKIQNPTNHTLHERQARAAIPSGVRQEVWRRDGGVCVKCGSRRNLEYDHIVPVSKGGSNTARNIELLCETCNRSKSASIQ